jgi:hypothetical protein
MPFYIAAKGRKFGAWIDADSRSNGYNAGDLIENPAYIIESLIRDEMLAEKKLVMTDPILANTIECQSLLSSVDDYYNGAYYHNLTTGFETTITDYDGAAKVLSLAGNDSSAVAGNIIELTSIKYSEKIDYSSFDTVGANSSGSRHGWVFAKSIQNIDNALEVIRRICYEAFVCLVKTSSGKYRLVSLDANPSTALVIEQNQMARAPRRSETHYSLIRNRFDIGFCYNYATGRFDRSIALNAGASGLTSNTFTPSSFTPDEDAGVTKYGAGVDDSLCGVSKTRYKVDGLLQENLQWVNDLATAELFVKKAVEWNYSPHITADVLGWFGDTASSSRKPLILYERGDQCYIDHPLLDSGISNTYVFMVTNKVIYKNERLVKLNLVQLR